MLYPILNESRNLIDLSGIWKFKLDDGTGFEQQWFAKKQLDDTYNIAVPASYNDQIENIDVRDHYGYVFYQKSLHLPKTILSERIVLRFGAVTHYAKVYLNGKLVTEHKGGFLPFEVEINDYVTCGENLLTVAVDNKVDLSTLPVGSESGGNMIGGAGLPPQPGVTIKKENAPNFDFFNYAGITRPVKIYTTPKQYINDITITSKVNGKDAVISYSVQTSGEGEVAVDIINEDGVTVGNATGTKGEVLIKDCTLWKPLKAYLYTARVKFGEDTYDQTFGVRTIEVKGTKFLINGEPFYFKGFGKHEDFYFNGRGLNEVLNVKDISLMKWTGANSFRTSHYPYSEEMMNLCDREGFVVIDETPAVGVTMNFGATKGPKPVDSFKVLRTHEHHHDVIVDMIARDKNHPCVVMWSIANESDTITFPDSAYEYYKPLYDLAHNYDPENRPVTIVGVQMGYEGDKTLPMTDVICLNRYYGWYIYGGDLNAAKQALKIELDYWKQFNKPLMMTEYGADTVAGLHLATPTMFTEEYQVEFLMANHEVFDNTDFFIGEQVWNFADFATIQGILRVEGNKKGIFTRDRRPKLAAHYLKSRWDKIPDFGYKK